MRYLKGAKVCLVNVELQFGVDPRASFVQKSIKFFNVGGATASSLMDELFEAEKRNLTQEPLNPTKLTLQFEKGNTDYT